MNECIDVAQGNFKAFKEFKKLTQHLIIVFCTHGTCLISKKNARIISCFPYMLRCPGRISHRFKCQPAFCKTKFSEYHDMCYTTRINPLADTIVHVFTHFILLVSLLLTVL